MAKRTIGAERLFSLGDYKNLRLIESVEFDDDGYTQDDLDLMRYMNILNLYMGFATHQDVLQKVKEGGFNTDAIVDMVFAARRELMEGARQDLQEVKQELVDETVKVLDLVDEILEEDITDKVVFNVLDEEIDVSTLPGGKK